MEPFGLLNFLKTLLPPVEEEPQSNLKPEEKSQPLPPPIEDEKENAYLQFLEAHEKRAKRK